MQTIRRTLVLAALLFGGVAAPASLEAQQTPADTAAILYDVAERLETRGRADAADALFDYILEQYPTTAVAERIAARRTQLAETRIDRSGRVEFLVWSTLFGLWQGVAIPAALGADDVPVYGVGLLAGGPLGFWLAKEFTDGRSISNGQAGLMSFGGNWGTWQGWGWREVLDIGSRRVENCYPTYDPETSMPTGQEDCFESIETPAEAHFTALSLGGLLGLGLGTWAAYRFEPAPATSTLINFGSLWGTWYGFTSAVMLGVGAAEEQPLTEEPTFEPVPDFDAFERRLTWVLAAGNLGLGTMAVLAPQWDMSRGRARLINIAGVAGLLGGWGVNLILQPDDEKVIWGIPTVTSIAGLAAGTYWTRDYDAEGTDGRGALIDVNDGRLGFDLPLPQPTIERVRTSEGWTTEPGVRLTIFQATF